MLLPYRVKFSDTKVTHFTPILALCTRLKSITFTETSIDETNKTQQKSEAQNLCLKCLLCLRISHGMVAT